MCLELYFRQYSDLPKNEPLERKLKHKTYPNNVYASDSHPQEIIPFLHYIEFLNI
jgi:hypothetical protein